MLQEIFLILFLLEKREYLPMSSPFLFIICRACRYLELIKHPTERRFREKVKYLGWNPFHIYHHLRDHHWHHSLSWVLGNSENANQISQVDKINLRGATTGIRASPGQCGCKIENLFFSILCLDSNKQYTIGSENWFIYLKILNFSSARNNKLTEFIFNLCPDVTKQGRTGLHSKHFISRFLFLLRAQMINCLF